ncbi:restriction endonuclease [Methanococcoides sp. LMO-2]|uniref:Restriction endonuclease n=1 Tax=Methanococcoides cohabitans TaxID=3136559 RepID=A0ABU9KX31_9EURY
MNDKANWSLDQLLETDPYDLENLVASLFRKMGYKADVTSRSKDGGVDVDVKLEHFGLSHRWLVQVKRYLNPVGVKEVREYSSLRYRERVDGVIIVTTSTFTEDAYREAAEHNVKLIEGQLLVSMLNHYCGDAPCVVSGGVEKKTTPSGGVVLKTGESVHLREAVSVDNKRLNLVITNRNIYFEQNSGGLFSKKQEISRRIEVKDLVGFSRSGKDILLVTGKKRFEVVRVRPKDMAGVLNVLEQLRTDYMRGESLLRLEQVKNDLIILTNRRLTTISSGEKEGMELRLKDIVGSEVTGSGMFSRQKLVISEVREGAKKHIFEVADSREWKNEIDRAVRSA